MKNFFLYNYKIFFIKSKKKFYNNLGKRAVIIYFALCLSVCVMVFMSIICIMVFMLIVSFKIIIISIKRGVLRFVSMPFLIFEKAMSKKIAPEMFRFVIMLFLIFEKAMSKKIVPEIFRFVSMLFLIFKKAMRK